MRVRIDGNDKVVAYGPACFGPDTYDGAPDDYEFGKYDYTPITPGVFNPDGFTLSNLTPVVDFELRQFNINQMYAYMAALVPAGLTQANFDLFLSDTATFVQQYIGGGSRLITWIETVNRNGYDARTVGFKTKTGYRGPLLSGTAGATGNYQRVNDILAILNNL
jgi:hypothetical protein